MNLGVLVVMVNFSTLKGVKDAGEVDFAYGSKKKKKDLGQELV